MRTHTRWWPTARAFGTAQWLGVAAPPGIHAPKDEGVKLVEAMAEAFRAADDPQKMMEILSKAGFKLAA